MKAGTEFGPERTLLGAAGRRRGPGAAFRREATARSGPAFVACPAIDHPRRDPLDDVEPIRAAIQAGGEGLAVAGFPTPVARHALHYPNGRRQTGG